MKFSMENKVKPKLMGISVVGVWLPCYKFNVRRLLNVFRFILGVTGVSTTNLTVIHPIVVGTSLLKKRKKKIPTDQHSLEPY